MKPSVVLWGRELGKFISKGSRLVERGCFLQSIYGGEGRQDEKVEASRGNWGEFESCDFFPSFSTACNYIPLWGLKEFASWSPRVHIPEVELVSEGLFHSNDTHNS